MATKVMESSMEFVIICGPVETKRRNTSGAPNLRSKSDHIRKRIESLESTLYKKLDTLIEYIKLSNYSDDECKVDFNDENIEKFVSYLTWIKAVDFGYKELRCRLRDDSTFDTRTENLKLAEYVEDKDMGKELTRHTNNLKVLFDKFENRSSNYNHSSPGLLSPSTMGPIRLGDTTLSSLLANTMTIYLNHMDNSNFWLNREDLVEIFRTPVGQGTDLLKSLIFDTSASFLMQELESNDCYEFQSFIDHHRAGLSSLIVNTYEMPTVEGVVALMLLAIEQFWVYNFVEAKIYLAKAVRLADCIQLNPDHSSRAKKKKVYCARVREFRKRAFEILIFIHSLIFTMLPGHPYIVCKSVLSFSHVATTQFNLPTKARLYNKWKHSLSYNIKTITSVRNENFNHSLNPCRNFVLVENNRGKQNHVYYYRAMTLHLKHYQFSLYVQSKYYADLNIYTEANILYRSIYLPNASRPALLTEIDGIIRTTPTSFKKPFILTTDYLKPGLTVSKDIDAQKFESLGSIGYLTLLLTQIYINYPLLWFDVKPLDLPDNESWLTAINAAEKVIGFYLMYIHQRAKLVENNKLAPIQSFTFSKCLPALFTLINAFAHFDQSSNLSKALRSKPENHINVYFKLAQKLITGLKLIANEHNESQPEFSRTTLDCKLTLTNLYEKLPAFELNDRFTFETKEV